MNKGLRAILANNGLALNKVTLVDGIRIMDTDQGSLVFKKKQNPNLNDIYNYLKSRAFDYFPNQVINDHDYDVYEYINDTNEPKEQKALDLIHLISLLHAKTTFYKEVDIEDYKKIYEDINDQLDEIDNYYSNLINTIDEEIYMSPSNYLIARNISKVFEVISWSKKNLKKWYHIVENKRKMRVTYVHNNLSLKHYLKQEKPYLISWEKSKVDLPIYDLYYFYQNHYLELDFLDLLYEYESKYPLLEEERILLKILLVIPKKINREGSEYTICQNARQKFDYLYKTASLVAEYRVRESVHQ